MGVVDEALGVVIPPRLESADCTHDEASTSDMSNIVGPPACTLDYGWAIPSLSGRQ